MFISVDHGIALAALDHHRHDFLSEEAGSLGGGGALLAAQGEGVLILTADLVVLSHVICSLRHGVDAIQLLHLRVDKAPANGGVLDLLRATKGRVSLAHHIGRAGHGLHTAGYGQLDLATGDGAKGAPHGIHTRGAESVKSHPGNGFRDAGQQCGHTSNVAVVFAGLVGAAHEHFVNGRRIQLRVALQQRAKWNRRQIIGAHRCQAAAEAADGCTHGVADKDFAGHSSPPAWPWAAAVRASSARSASSSSARGASVVTTFSAKRMSQPVFSITCSRVTPGCREVTTNSLVPASGSMMHRSVTMPTGPLPGSPSCLRCSPPSPKPTEVMNASLSTKVRCDCLRMISTCLAEPAISGAPPAPGKRTLG